MTTLKSPVVTLAPNICSFVRHVEESLQNDFSVCHFIVNQSFVVLNRCSGRRAVSLERRHSGGSTGHQSRSTEVTDSFSSASQNSSQDNSRTYKDQIGRYVASAEILTPFRFSPAPAVTSRSTSLSPTKCAYNFGSLPRSPTHPSATSGGFAQKPLRPPQRGPMRSRSSDRVVPSRNKANGEFFIRKF